MAGVAHALLIALNIYSLLIMVWTFGSWFPQWRYQEWFRTVDRIVAPFVALFSPLPLRYGGFDFTPMAAMLSVYLFQRLLILALERSQF